MRTLRGERPVQMMHGEAVWTLVGTGGNCNAMSRPASRTGFRWLIVDTEEGTASGCGGPWTLFLDGPTGIEGPAGFYASDECDIITCSAMADVMEWAKRLDMQGKAGAR